VRKTAAILGLLVVNSSAGWACHVCAAALGDQVLPPIYAWALLGIGWYFATALLSLIFQANLPGFSPYVVITFLILAAGFLVYAPFLPPLLIPVAAWGCLQASISTRSPLDRPSLRVGLSIVGFVGLVAFLLLASWSYHIHTTRTRVDFLLQYSGTAPGRGILHRMTKEDPEPLDEYRNLYQQAGLVTAAFVAERIAEIGNPERDIPFLESRLDDFRAETWADMYLADVEAAIANLERKKAKGLDSETPTE
jgi:hypothetical protein